MEALAATIPSLLGQGDSQYDQTRAECEHSPNIQKFGCGQFSTDAREIPNPAGELAMVEAYMREMKCVTFCTNSFQLNSIRVAANPNLATHFPLKGVPLLVPQAAPRKNARRAS